MKFQYFFIFSCFISSFLTIRSRMSIVSNVCVCTFLLLTNGPNRPQSHIEIILYWLQDEKRKTKCHTDTRTWHTAADRENTWAKNIYNIYARSWRNHIVWKRHLTIYQKQKFIMRLYINNSVAFFIRFLLPSVSLFRFSRPAKSS